MKKNKRFIFFLAFLWAGITLSIFYTEISGCLDYVFLKIIGKSFSQRGKLIQMEVIVFCALLTAFLVTRLISNKKRNAAVIWFSLAVCVSLLCIICAFQTIRRDDYWEIHDAHFYGFPEFIRYEYVTFNGRYFSLFLRSLYQFVTPTVYMNILLTINILSLCSAFIYLMKLLSDVLSVQERYIGGICSALGILFMSPNIWEVWFWASGTFVYGVGIMFAIWASVLMIDIEISSGPKTTRTIAAAVCIFCACGCSELITASVCFFSLMILILPRLLYKRAWNIRNVLLTLESWALTVLILLTSGNFVNAGRLSEEQGRTFTDLLLSFPGKVLISADTIIRYTYSRLEYLVLFAGLFFILGLCFTWKSIPLKTLFSAIIVLFITAAGVLTINALIGFMPARVISIPLDWILLGISLLMLQVGSYVRNKFVPDADLRIVSGLISLALLTIAGHFYLRNIGTILDIRTAWIARDQVLSAMGGSDVPVETCAIPVMGSGQADPSDDPTRDFNIVTAYYYGFPSITADHICSPFE